MEQAIKAKYDLLNVPGTSGTQNESTSEEDSDFSSDEEGLSLTKKLNENYQDEIETAFIFDKKHKEKKKGKKEETKAKRIRSRSKIPVHLKGLMGEANLRFARGDWTTAEKMCLEVIRQEPHAFEPYQTLAQMYENKDQDISMEYLTIAAHLNNSADQWISLGEYYTNVKKNIRGAVTCYTRALRSQRRNYELHLKRISLLESINDFRFAIRCKVCLLHAYSKKFPNEIITLAKELASYYHKEMEYGKAVEIFSVLFTKVRKHITPELVNMYLELLLLNANYTQCLDIFVQHCNIDIEVFVNEENKLHVLSFSMPEHLEIDLRIKFIICLIHLEAFDLVQSLITPFLEDTACVEKNGDLYLDIAESFMCKRKYKQALDLLTPLIKSKNFSLAAVWLKYAESLKECGMSEKAISAYQRVVKLAPLHIEVRHPLSQLLIAAGRNEEAMKALAQDPETHAVDVDLLIKQMDFLLQNNKIREYFDCVDLLLRRHCVPCKYRIELRQVTFQETFNEKVNRLNRIRKSKGDPPITLDIASIKEPSIQDEYNLYRSILDYCYQHKHYIQLKRFAFYGLCSLRFKTFVSDISIIAIFSCLLTHDMALAFAMLRDLLLRPTLHPNHRLWNWFCITTQTQQDLNHTKFLMRFSKKCKQDFLKLLDTCVAISSGSYRIGTMHLLPSLKTHATPLTYLLLGVTFLQNSCQKYRDMKINLTQCCYAFFSNYAKNRGADAKQEILYNLGRMYQQYGVMHLAVHYYKQVLAYENTKYLEFEHILDLKKEAAYNLCIIYKASDHYIAARKLMVKYLTI